MGLLHNLKVKRIGRRGENKVIAKLNPMFFGVREHRLINNLILTDEMGHTHQIDHVEIRQNGIFCVETKNYEGWILGNENSDHWTQVIYKVKHQIPNPIKQNASHAFHIKKILGPKYRIYSVIVMVQNNADKLNIPNVVNLKKLKKYLNKFDDGTWYSIEELDQIEATLRAANTKISTRQHVKNIKQTQKQLEQGICPRCGGKLILRNGPNGPFYGCSNYPKCKFIKKI